VNTMAGCVTVIRVGAAELPGSVTLTVPDRAPPVAFGRAVKVNDPLALPDGGLLVNHDDPLRTDAVHGPPVVIVNTRLPPSAGASQLAEGTGGAEDPDCVTDTVRDTTGLPPVTVTIAVRGAVPVFAVAVNVNDPLPFPIADVLFNQLDTPLGIETVHDTFDVTVST